MAGGDLDALEVGQVADEHRGRDAAQMLGHPQADIGRAGDDGGLGVFGQHLRKIGGVGGQDRAFVAARQLDAAGGNGGQCRADAVALDRQRIHVLAARLSRGERGLHDRLIAGAAAEVALQRRFDGAGIGARVFHPQPVKRHHKARGAKAALAAVMFDHRRLHRMQPAIGAAQMLDRDDMAAMARGKEADAGVHRLIAQPAVMQASDQHRAGAAVALGAAFLGAGQAAVQAQEVQQRIAGADLVQADRGVVQKKAQFLAHRGLAWHG